jgi:hypothetical protein
LNTINQYADTWQEFLWNIQSYVFDWLTLGLNLSTIYYLVKANSHILFYSIKICVPPDNVFIVNKGWKIGDVK